MKTYYANIDKKKLCNRNNGELKILPRFDFQMQDYFSVIFIDSLNKIISIDPTDSFYIAGGTQVMKDSENLLFYSENFTLENDRLLFTVDTYTDNYLNLIKNSNTPIYLEIGIINEKKTILLQDIVLAQPRVYLDGVAPTDITLYYTKAEIDQKIANIEITETDPIYTADKPNIALKSEIPTKVSELQNDEGYIDSYTETDPIYTADKPNIALKSEIPTKVSELQNDSNFISDYIETDPIYTADKPNIALKSEIPTKVSELQNDEGYIDSYTETDPLYTADKPNIALKSEIEGLAGYKEIQNTAEQSALSVENFRKIKDAYYYTNYDEILTIPTVDFTDQNEQLSIKTIELWVKNNVAVTTIVVPESYIVVDVDNFPTELTEGATSVFVLRFSSNGDQMNTCINYAYEFIESIGLKTFNSDEDSVNWTSKLQSDNGILIQQQGIMDVNLTDLQPYNTDLYLTYSGQGVFMQTVIADSDNGVGGSSACYDNFQYSDDNINWIDIGAFTTDIEEIYDAEKGYTYYRYTINCNSDYMHKYYRFHSSSISNQMIVCNIKMTYKAY